MPDVPSQGKTHRLFLPQVEALRGFAALTVALGHCYLLSGGFMLFTGGPAIFSLFVNGLFDPLPPVVLFFVISGFVLGIQLRDQPTPSMRGYVIYIVRRIFRLIPALWVAVLFSFASAWCFGTSGVTDLNPRLFISSLLLQDWTLNIVVWSLYVEVICSSIFPVLYWIYTNVNLMGNLALLVALTLLMGYSATPLALHFLVCFHVGLLVGAVRERKVQLFGGWMGLPLLVIGFVGYAWAPELAVGASRWDFSHCRDWMPVAVPACFLLLTVVTNGWERISNKVLTSNVVGFLGRISFSFYLLHWTIEQLCYIVMVGHLRIAYPTVSSVTILMALTVTFSTIIASICYYCVERPFIRWGRALGAMIETR